MKELETWGSTAQFSLIDYLDTKQQKMQIIKDWKDLFTQIGDNQSLLSSLKDSVYYKNFGMIEINFERTFLFELT